MPLRRRTSKPTLRESADALRAQAREAEKRARFADEAHLAQVAVRLEADILQKRADDADRCTQLRNDISGRLGTATRSSWELQRSIEQTREKLLDSLRAGNSIDAEKYGTTLGSLQVAYGAAQSVIADIEVELAAVLTVEISAQERASIATLRSLALSPTRSRNYVVPQVTPNPRKELEELGRRTREEAYRNPKPAGNTQTPIRDLRQTMRIG